MDTNTIVFVVAASSFGIGLVTVLLAVALAGRKKRLAAEGGACPWCRAENAASAERCERCGRDLPPGAADPRPSV